MPSLTQAQIEHITAMQANLAAVKSALGQLIVQGGKRRAWR